MKCTVGRLLLMRLRLYSVLQNRLPRQGLKTLFGKLAYLQFLQTTIYGNPCKK